MRGALGGGGGIAAGPGRGGGNGRGIPVVAGAGGAGGAGRGGAVAPAGGAARPKPDPASVEMIVAMGFKASSATEALIRAKGNVELALNLLAEDPNSAADDSAAASPAPAGPKSPPSVSSQSGAAAVGSQSPILVHGAVNTAGASPSPSLRDSRIGAGGVAPMNTGASGSGAGMEVDGGASSAHSTPKPAASPASVTASVIGSPSITHGASPSPARPSAVLASPGKPAGGASPPPLLHPLPAIYKPGVSAHNLKRLGLGEGSFMDVRDTVGKWLEAEIKAVKGDAIHVHYLQWEAKWDEWLKPNECADRFADFHQFSGDSRSHPYRLNMEVDIYPPKPVPMRWRPGTVTQIDTQYGSQVQITYVDDTPQQNKYQYWFPVSSDEIHPRTKPGQKDAKGADKEWFVGKMIEAQDTYKKWFLSEVVEVDEPGRRIKVHYDGFQSKWDDWLHLDLNKDRIRPMGSTDPKSREQMLKEQEELKFRQTLADQQLQIVDMDKDGNCLFRCFAHQIYGDPERHPEVRAACCDYEDANREYFKNFVDGDFDQFLAKRRLDAWGDHIEIEALRELYNKNVIIYYSEGAKQPRPLGGGNDVPTVRLAYHGGSHYNSVINPTTFKPFGDGKDSKVNMRQLRIDEEKKAPTLARNASVSTAAAASSPHSMMRPVDADKTTLDEKEVRQLWLTKDKEAKDSIRFALLRDLLGALLNALVMKKGAARKKVGKESESLQKAASEVPLENLVNQYNNFRHDGKISWKDFKTQFFEKTLNEFLWSLTRMD